MAFLSLLLAQEVNLAPLRAILIAFSESNYQIYAMGKKGRDSSKWWVGDRARVVRTKMIFIMRTRHIVSHTAKVSVELWT